MENDRKEINLKQRWYKFCEMGYFPDCHDDPILWIDAGPSDKEMNEHYGLCIDEWKFTLEETEQALINIRNWCNNMLEEIGDKETDVFKGKT